MNLREARYLLRAAGHTFHMTSHDDGYTYSVDDWRKSRSNLEAKVYAVGWVNAGWSEIEMTDPTGKKERAIIV